MKCSLNPVTYNINYSNKKEQYNTQRVANQNISITQSTTTTLMISISMISICGMEQNG